MKEQRAIEKTVQTKKRRLQNIYFAVELTKI